MTRWLQLGFVTLLLLITGCRGSSDDGAAERTDGGDDAPASTSTPSSDDEVADSQLDVEPQPYVPAGRPGSAAAYDALVDQLAGELPADIRATTPWPDLRDPDPIEAQIDIFEMWIWMEANHPEPDLVQLLAAANSPSYEAVSSTFQRRTTENILSRRRGAGYQSFDHVAVTFESSGLPLWVARDVPDDAVVVYYRDSSGPSDTFDRDSGEKLYSEPAVPVREWLSIMVPTDVGWLLWKDQILESDEGELDYPELPPPPGPNDERTRPRV